ncbi:NT-type C2 domain [Sesbania bispinosa]|nr:NT-type C2 domain [Sesbania bispinosa]
MFRWRSERNRVKAVFKLQFHVTQMLQSGVDALVLSIVPGDIGKPTTRLEKATVRGGVCKWENPVYETVKFNQDPKTGKFSERIYHFVVSTGLSKASSFGEVSIDFSDYAEATKLSSVSLPIKNSHSEAVLHVSIQRLQENNDKREEEECEDGKLKPNDRSLRTYLSNGDADGRSKSDSSDDVSAKANTNRAELSADCRTSSGSDITLSSSDGSSGLDTPRELGLRNTTIHPNTNGFLSDVSHTSEPQKPAVNVSASMYDVHQRSPWDWSAGSEHGLSMDDSINALPRERSQQTSDMENEKLKAEIAALARQVNVSDLELQTLRKQIVKESKRGQDLSKEVISLKEERDKLKTECENLRSFRKRMDEAKNLENQLKKQSEEFSNSLATIKSLEAEISRLEEELEKQAQGFEADLDSVTREKIEQEQRAIRAEEALRNTRHKNANTAERLQEEFKRLSMQMASTFDANEKATMRALTEASELRAHKRLLEEMLHKVKAELQSAKADHKVKLNELSNKIDMMTVQIQQMLMEIEDKSKQLENQRKHEEQVSRDYSEEIQMLKAENEKLKVEISCLSEQVKQKEILRTDLEFMKKSLEESESLLQGRMVERNELVITIALLKKEAERLLDELNRMMHLKDEEEKMGRLLNSELEALKAQHSDLRHSLIEGETEKEKLRKQVLQLKGELKKKDDALTNIEKRYKDSNGRTQLSDGTKTIPKNKKSASITQNSKELTNLMEKIKMLEGLIQSKETALETSASSFLAKERELQSKIKELEDKVEEFNQSIALQKVLEDKSITTTSDDRSEERGSVEHLNDTTCVSQENEVAVSSFNSDVNLSEKEAEISIKDNNGDGSPCDILTELSSLKERNESMESELKELQERYSEMSLKFAEVEGERQKLVMTVRSLKNARKG